MTLGSATDVAFVAPKEEIVWVEGCDSDGTPRYFITSNRMRTNYFLHAIEKGVWKKIARARSPVAFEGRIKLR